MLEQSAPLERQLERVRATMDAFSEKRLRAEMILKFADVMRSCYTSFVKALDVPYGTPISPILLLFLGYRGQLQEFARQREKQLTFLCLIKYLICIPFTA
jgi:hypothetical protein